MKKPEIGDIFLWKGDLVKVIGRADEPTHIMEMIEDDRCPFCAEQIGRRQFSVIHTSPLFQENAKAIKTLKDE